MRLSRDESGSALIEIVWLGLLLLIPLVYIVLAVFDVQRASYGASAATRAAGRAFALAPDSATAEARAIAAARVALADHGIELDPDAVTITCAPDPGSCLSPDALITVNLDLAMPLPLIPAALGSDGPTVRVSATHVTPFGAYSAERS